MRWMVALIWRLPPRSSRCRSVLPELTGLGEQMRGDLGDQVGDLGLERLDRLGELADAAQLVAGDPHAHRLVGAGEPAGYPRSPGAVKQRAPRELRFGPEVVQMPLQRVVDRDPLANQPFPVID